MTIDEQIVEKLPAGLCEKEVLSIGFDIGVDILTPLHGYKSKKYMQHYYSYDEDFCSDLVSKYFHMRRKRQTTFALAE
jgi:hypothetical protein